MLELNNLSYRYPGQAQNALSGINLQLAAGQCLGLLGANGAGKTTLLSIISGLRQPSQGQMLSHSRPAVIPQQLAFYAELGVLENLTLFADLYRLKGQQRHQRLSHVLERCALETLAKRRAGTLSGGEQRRLNVAIGLLQPAELYLFDEPTVGVDAHSRQLLLSAIAEQVQSGSAAIYTSHYLDEVERIAQRVVLLEQGQIRLDLQLDSLLGEQPGLLLRWPGQAAEPLEQLLQHLNLSYVRQADGWQIEKLEAQHLPILAQFIAAQAQLPQLMRFGRPSLEQLYLHLCGGQL